MSKKKTLTFGEVLFFAARNPDLYFETAVRSGGYIYQCYKSLLHWITLNCGKEMNEQSWVIMDSKHQNKLNKNTVGGNCDVFWDNNNDCIDRKLSNKWLKEELSILREREIE